jgi:hypothetical protein
VATDLVEVGSGDAVRVSLLALSARLEAEWRAALDRLLDSPPESHERDMWAIATNRLTEALDRLERYARGLDASLGRRDWAARRPRLYRVPDQASSLIAPD